MKMLLCLLLAVVCVSAKKELKLSGCSGKTPIVDIVSMKDHVTTGPLVRNSELEVTYNPKKDTSDHGNFDIKIKLSLKKYFVFGYAEIPSYAMDIVGNIVKEPGVINYLGNGQFEHKCPFKSLSNTCLPSKSMTKVHLLQPLFDKVKAGLGSYVKLASGWYKLKYEAVTPWEETALCFNLEFKLSM